MIGTSLGPYKILEPLGAGGMGEVYLAEDTRLGRKVALKVLPAEFAGDPERLARFEQEARAAAALNHPNIAAVFDVGSEAPEGSEIATHFMVQEYLEGEPLSAHLDKGTLPLKRTLKVANEIAEALAAAHAAGIIHRDLKPANIFITNDGPAKILDFGLARWETEGSGEGDSLTAAGGPVTEPGAILGTVQYMSPEQVRGERADARSDIFAFGCVLYEMLTGNRAFSGETAAETMVAILKEDPSGLAETAAGAPGGELRRVVTHCLEKKPEGRFQSARDLAFALTLVGCGADADESAIAPGGEGIPADDARPLQTAEGTEASVAVLPFATLSSDQEIEHFRDGLAEEVISALSRVSGLRVASRTRDFSDESPDVREIGEQLNVRMVLQGSVRRAGSRLRIGAQLVNVADGYYLWSETFEREMDDVFAVQEEIARSIAYLVETRESAPLSVGVLQSIAYRRRDGEDMREAERCVVRVGRGLALENRPGGKREVTLLSAEAWQETCRELGAELPWYSRRANLLIGGIDLAEAITHAIRVGEVEIKVHGETKPCDIMDEQHQGLREALTLDCRGGVYGQVLVGGTIRVGDRVSVVLS